MAMPLRGEMMNYRLVAIQVGDLLKWDVSRNVIDRLAHSIFRFQREAFPHESITSQRAQLIYDWIMSLAKQRMDPEVRSQLLLQFCRSITPPKFKDEVEKILENAGGASGLLTKEDYTQFAARNFHPIIVEHCRDLFLQGNFFHAVFEAAKLYNKGVRIKAQSGKDGETLMMSVWGCDKGVLKVTQCSSETDANIQDGVKFLSAGLMRAIRNPTAHEPALHWPINRQDCLDILSFISFLYRKLDEAVYFV